MAMSPNSELPLKLPVIAKAKSPAFPFLSMISMAYGLLAAHRRSLSRAWSRRVQIDFSRPRA